jgi:hypothetical protein
VALPRSAWQSTNSGYAPTLLFQSSANTPSGLLGTATTDATGTICLVSGWEWQTAGTLTTTAQGAVLSCEYTVAIAEQEGGMLSMTITPAGGPDMTMCASAGTFKSIPWPDNIAQACGFTSP